MADIPKPEEVLQRIFTNLSLIEDDFKLYETLTRKERLPQAYMSDEAFGICKKVIGELKTRPGLFNGMLDFDEWQGQLDLYESAPQYESRLDNIRTNINKLRIVNGQKGYDTLLAIYGMRGFINRKSPELSPTIALIAKLFERGKASKQSATESKEKASPTEPPVGEETDTADSKE